jgi:zinc transport system substrate-binding protein
MNLRAAALIALASSSLLLSACGGTADGSIESGDGAAAVATTDEGLQVVASFYPLQYVAERVAGDRAQVVNLTPPGAEAHDVELAPRDVAALTEADLLLYLGGFQPAVDDAVASAQVPAAFDVAEVADLGLAAGADPHGHGAEDEAHAEEGEAHAEEGEAHGDEAHAGGAPDPHFWLDPARLAGIADDVAAQLAQADPEGAQTYQANAAALQEDLQALDAEMQEALASCAERDLVTSHEAFAYLADRYGFRQVGISGLSPEDEPTPAQLAQVTDFVRDNQVSTIYFETLVSPDVAETVAQETGASTAVLDPLEGLTDASAGDDYPEVMRANLETLRAGQSCA